MERDQSAPFIIGFGALNVDIIASASGLSQHAAERITESTARFEWNVEGPVERQSIIDAMQNLGSASLSYSLGGSAWLTIYSLAQMRLGLRLGYVGVLGRIEAPGISFRSQMAELGINDTWVGDYTERGCGICLSFIDDDERKMYTHPGANVMMRDYLDKNFEGIAKYLSSTHYVHVTSFLDQFTPETVLSVLRRARELNPELKISFDPGFEWAENPNKIILAILELADLVFVNYREFKALGRYVAGESDDKVARKLLARCRTEATVFVTKRYDYTEVFRELDGSVLSYRFHLQHYLSESEPEDATGAGDVFAAAVLSALESNRLKVELGGYLGLTLARYKLQAPRDAPNRLPDLSGGFLQQKETPLRTISPPQRVLIMHGPNPQWRQVQSFIENRCGLPTEPFEPASNADGDLAALLRGPISRCGFAVCILDATADGPDGLRRPEQAIVHQAGILQGSYGFSRVAILIEDGCEIFTNISGLIRLDFPRGRVDAKFVELHRMLQRELLGNRSRQVRPENH